MTIPLEEALVKLATTAIICLFVYLIFSKILRWMRQMVEDGLPMFTYGELVWKNKTEDSDTGETIQMGFAPPEEPEQSKETTAKEQKDAVLKDPITMFSALLRGEVDIDDIT